MTDKQFVSRPPHERMAEFEAVVKPLIQWMNENGLHPHHTVIVTQTGAELLEGNLCVRTNEFVKD